MFSLLLITALIKLQMLPEKPAPLYERFNDEQVGKSYALNYLFNKINADYGSYRAYDGYFYFRCR